MGKKISIDEAKERLEAKGWKTKLDDRYLNAFSDTGDAFQLVPTTDGKIELNAVRQIPELKAFRGPGR